MPKGWIYLITNPAMPGLVKVGYSMKDPTIRAKDLAGTGMPHAYVVAYEALVSDPYVVEQKVHSLLERHREGKEWFRCDIARAHQAILQVAASAIMFDTMHAPPSGELGRTGKEAFAAWERQLATRPADALANLNKAIELGYPPAIELALPIFASDPALNTEGFDLIDLKRTLFNSYVAAGDRGSAASYFEAACYLDGDEDLPIEANEHKRLVHLAAEGGCRDAVAYVARETIENGASTAEMAKALQTLNALFLDGHVGAGISLATLYENGSGVEKDTERSLAYWESVAELSGSPLWKQKVARMRNEQGGH